MLILATCRRNLCHNPPTERRYIHLTDLRKTAVTRGYVANLDGLTEALGPLDAMPRGRVLPTVTLISPVDGVFSVNRLVV